MIYSLIAIHSLPLILKEYLTGSWLSVPNTDTFFPSIPGQTNSLCWCFAKVRSWVTENTEPLLSYFQSPKILQAWQKENAVHQESKKAKETFWGNSSVSSLYCLKKSHWQRGKTKKTTVKASISSMSSQTQATAEQSGAFTYWMRP